MAEDAAVPEPETLDQAAPEPAAAEARLEEQQLEEQRLEQQRLKELWKRAAADLENARKRHARELRHEVEAERRRICLAWLPVLDNLELALEHAAERDDPIVTGVRAVRAQGVGLLESLGYQRDDEAGVPFDPVRHEVVSVVDDPGAPPETVVKVLRPGYGRAPDRQLRAAAVVVSRGQE